MVKSSTGDSKSQLHSQGSNSKKNYGSVPSGFSDRSASASSGGGGEDFIRPGGGFSGRSSMAESLRDSIALIGASARDGIYNSLRFGGSRVSVRDLGGSSTISKSSFNLIKNLVGAGVLALPSGV